MVMISMVFLREKCFWGVVFELIEGVLSRKCEMVMVLVTTKIVCIGSGVKLEFFMGGFESTL